MMYFVSSERDLCCGVNLKSAPSFWSALCFLGLLVLTQIEFQPVEARAAAADHRARQSLSFTRIGGMTFGGDGMESSSRPSWKTFLPNTKTIAAVRQEEPKRMRRKSRYHVDGRSEEQQKDRMVSTTSNQTPTRLVSSTAVKQRKFRPSSNRKSGPNGESGPKDETPQGTHRPPTVSEIADDLVKPLVPVQSWEASTGAEWEDKATVEKLAKVGRYLCRTLKNDWIEWRPADKNTAQRLETNEQQALLDGDILVHVGQAKEQTEPSQGSQLPMVRTKSILPLSASDMANLLMDSSQVQVYNKMSLGREDIRIYNENTKIVCNLTKPPIAKSNMISVTLMHKHEIIEPNHEDSSYLVVTRAVPKLVDPQYKDLPRNDILLGVNLLEPVNGNKDACIMTAITHVYSPALPMLLAKKIGVKSAVNFVKDIRKACGVEAEHT